MICFIFTKILLNRFFIVGTEMQSSVAKSTSPDTDFSALSTLSRFTQVEKDAYSDPISADSFSLKMIIKENFRFCTFSLPHLL